MIVHWRLQVYLVVLRLGGAMLHSGRSLLNRCNARGAARHGAGAEASLLGLLIVPSARLLLLLGHGVAVRLGLS